MRLKLQLVALALLSQSPAWAVNRAEVLETEAVDVVGTTPLSSVGVPINEVPANIQAISAHTISTQKSLDISEILNQNAASVTTNDTVGNPYQPDVIYRGFTASPLLGTPQGLSVFVDGVRVNESFGDIVNWDLIPANAIANINLVPGSNPLFGLNTLGGALSIHTKSGAENPGVALSLTSGAWGRNSLMFEAGGREKSFDYFTAGTLFHEDGWRNHSKSDVRQLFSKLGWQNETSNLDLSLILGDNQLNGVQALPLEMLNTPTLAYSWPDKIDNKMEMLTLNGSHFFSDNRLISGNVYYRHLRSNAFNSNLNDDYNGAVYDPTITDTFKATNALNSTDTDGFGSGVQMSWLDDVLGHKNQFSVGASVDLGRTSFMTNTQVADISDHETVSLQPLYTPQTVRLKSSSDYYGLYGTEKFSLTDKLHITLSGRYNIALIDLNGSSLDVNDPTLVAGNLNGSHRYNRFNPALGVNYNPSATLNFYGGYNEGMRAPSPIELACADPMHPCALPNAFGGDPDLQKVVSKTWEGGVRGRLNEHVNWNLGVFHTENNNDIAFIASNTSGSGYFQNVGNTLRQGIEFGVNGQFEKLHFAVNYSVTDATFKTPFTAVSKSNSSADDNGVIQVQPGNTIPGVARHIFKMRLDYEILPRWTLGSNLIAFSSQYARGDENNQDAHGKIPGYAIINLDTQYSINSNWKLFAKVNNLFNKDYSTFGLLGPNQFTGPGNSYAQNIDTWNTHDQFRTPAPTRAAWVGISYQFGKAGSANTAHDN